MKKKLGITLVAMLGFCAISSTALVATNTYHPQNAVAVYAEGEEETTGTEQPVETETTEPAETDEVKEWFDKFFSPDKVAMYVSWIAYIATFVGLAVKLKQLKATNNLTLKNVSDEVKAVLKQTISEEVAKKFDDMLPSVLATQEKTNAIMAIFAKILALSQENTPESRVAILNLIEELGAVSKEVIDNSKEVIEAGVKLAEQAKEDLDKKIDEIVESYDGTSI